MTSDQIAREVLTTLGLEPGPLFWSTIGACIGITFAQATTRLKATMIFFATGFVCSLFGVWLASKFQGGEAISRNAFSCVLSIFFQPLLNALISKVPGLVDKVSERFGVGKGGN